MISRAFAPALLLLCSSCLRPTPDAPAPSRETSEARPAPAQREVPPPPSKPEVPDEPSPRDVDQPWMSRASWWKRHWALLDISADRRRQAELVFIGDSITEGFDERVWRELYAPHHALKLGIGGDKTQNVLFRIEDGEIDGTSPRVVVLMIGTNNLGAWPADAIARGVGKIVQSLVTRLPRTQVLVVGILPRDERADSPKRTEVAETNALLSRLADGVHVRYVDVGAALLEPDGSIAPSVMGDFLHPTSRGYRQLAEALQPTLDALLAR
jgi:lysophospholipase L1-like esterase